MKSQSEIQAILLRDERKKPKFNFTIGDSIRKQQEIDRYNRRNSTHIESLSDFWKQRLINPETGEQK